MLRRCGNPDGLNPTYADVELRMTLEEWLEWSIPRYEEFIRSNPNISPSVSRFEDQGHYEINNLEIISRDANLKLAALRQTISYTDLVCPGCKTDFKIETRNYIFRLKRNKHGIFCSRSCSGKYAGKIN